MDYAEIDRRNILDFITAKGGECDVEDILKSDGIERLRVYPLIYRMEAEGVLTITAFGELGAPEKVAKT